MNTEQSKSISLHLRLARMAATVVITLGALAALSPAVAQAEALVIVKVRGAAENAPDGKVTLQSKDKKSSYSCETKKGTCKIENVGGGLHSVSFVPKTGAPSEPRNVMIPPQGKVTLFVAPGRDAKK